MTLALLIAAGLLAFANGANDNFKPVDTLDLQSRRVAETMGRRITGMNRGQGLTANVIGTGLVIGASLAGFPVSTTHVSTGAIFGIAAWTGSARPRVVLEIVLAWIGTLPLAILLAYAAATVGSS